MCKANFSVTPLLKLTLSVTCKAFQKQAFFALGVIFLPPPCLFADYLISNSQGSYRN